MSNALPADFRHLVTAHDGHATTNTLIVAEQFGMQHKNVLQAVKNLECSDEFNRLNFQPISYYDARGRQQRAFELTRDGFMFLAMGFTGSKAAALKEAFITAFNQLEQRLRAQESGNVSALRAALLSSKPRWCTILRGHRFGLKQIEIARLLGVSRETVRAETRRMQALGLLPAEPQQLELLEDAQ